MPNDASTRTAGRAAGEAERMTSPPASDNFQNPRRGYCDLVMKGGITSGVVYPQAILELAEDYRFRSVGGGSVGAIAAALAAAGELNREGRGFEAVKETQQTLLGREDFLLDLFRPTEVARPLMETLVDLARVRDRARKDERSDWAAVLRGLAPALLRRNPRTFLPGAVAGAALGVALVYVLAEGLDSALGAASIYTAMLVVGLVCALVVAVLWTAAVLLVILLKKVPSARNFYGMCTGHGDHPPGRLPPLTDWLSPVLDEISGIGSGPLLFRHLEAKKRPGEDRGISLEVMTTNLNHNEPYLFPRELDTFVFEETEMRSFFPGYVVDHMVREVPTPKVRLPEGFYFLPRGEAMPVIVPVRMAVSFPILLCAVPLYTVDPEILAGYEENPFPLDENDHLQVNWFSDSGICSNFPIHSFDAWLPRHPTFGINLTSLSPRRKRSAFSARDIGEAADGTAARDERSRAKVRLPRPDEPDYPEWSGFRGLAGFARAIFSSAQNYRDNMQSRLPSYQERVVQVRLEADEGGLNLAMDTETIARITERGKEAGELLKTFRFDHHQWVRLRVLMNQLEEQLEGAKGALDTILREGLIDRQLDGGFPHAIRDAENVETVRGVLAALRELTRRIEEGHAAVSPSVPPKGPHVFPPVAGEELEPTLRVTPDV